MLVGYVCMGVVMNGLLFWVFYSRCVVFFSVVLDCVSVRVDWLW